MHCSIVVSTIEFSTSLVKLAGGVLLLLPEEKLVAPSNSTVAPASGARKIRKKSRPSPDLSWPIAQLTVFVCIALGAGGAVQLGLADPRFTNAVYAAMPEAGPVIVAVALNVT